MISNSFDVFEDMVNNQVFYVIIVISDVNFLSCVFYSNF